MKSSLPWNDRTAVKGSGVTTTSIVKYFSTDSFKNVRVESADGKTKYNVREVNIVKATDENGKQLPNTTTTINSGATQNLTVD